MPSFATSEGSPLTEYTYTGSPYVALVWQPVAATSATPLPVLIHLHGAGEAGKNVWGILAQGQSGTPPVELHLGRAPTSLADNFIVVTPQSPRSRWDAAQVCEFVKHFVANPPSGMCIDSCRVYISGHSNGASGALEAAAIGFGGGGRFAACVPVAPGGCGKALGHLKDTPTWIFHGINDVVLPIRCADEIHNALCANDGRVDESRRRYTRIESCPAPPGYPMFEGHGTPVVAWATDGLFEWLLSHRVAV